MKSSDFEDVEIELQSRGTPAERLRSVSEAFADLARKQDAEAAEIILARLEGRNAGDPAVRRALDRERVGLIAEGISTIRRGDIVDLLATAAAAGTGVGLGYASHKVIDARVAGVPLNGLLGVAGVAAGASLDSTLTARNVLFSGGALFALGSALYSIIHRLPEENGQ